MKKAKKVISGFIAVCLIVPFASCQKAPENVAELFINDSKISYSLKAYPLSEKKNNTSDWRQGMVSGNGSQGVIESGDAYNDSLIYQNIHFIMPNKNSRTCPETFNELSTVKENITSSTDITDNASYDDVYAYHPGGALRIKSEKKSLKDFVRYTDYETAETSVRYTDSLGTFERRTFTSRADNVTITKLSKSSSGTKINTTLSFDNISAFANYGDGNEVGMKYKKLADKNGDYLAFIAHYPEFENSELINGGYGTVCLIVTEGGKKEVIDGESISDEQYAADTNPAIKITDADNVYIIAFSDRTDSMGSLADFSGNTEYTLLESMKKTVSEVAEKYTDDNKFSYENALGAHTKLYTPVFDAVTLSLTDTPQSESNEALLKAQKGSDTLNSALMERAYYSGRYAYLCCSGSSTSRLYGMWTGEWNPGWGSKYTMDANVNLQTSSMNTGNMAYSYLGYTYFLLRQMPDWEENAYATHGFTDALQAPVNTDGDKAVITETCYPYPFRYWNAGASWCLQPLYETLKCYGDVKIPFSDEFDINKLKSVLSPTSDDLTDKYVNTLTKRGYLTLEKDILLPLLTKSANYWKQLLSPEYYTDSDGNIHYEKGKTALAADEYYTILPSYSPENNPKNYPSPSVANTAIDISACRDNLKMLITVMKDLDKNADTAAWETLIEKLPPYTYDSTGALKEFCCNQFEENNEHRHLSHMYCAWPLNETQNDDALRSACIKAIENRTSENEASHALVHRSLIAARLKDRAGLTDALTKLMNHKIHYDSLMTNHDYDRGSCYCTDFAIGYLGIVNESLVYSDTGVVELLPALPESGFSSGTLTGIRLRSEAEISKLTWDENAKTATVTITSDKAQTLEISCKLFGKSETISFKAGESKTISF